MDNASEQILRKPINITVNGVLQERIIYLKKINRSGGTLLLHIENKDNPFELKELAIAEQDFMELIRRKHTQFKKGFKDFAQHIVELVEETLKQDTRYFASMHKESDKVDVFSIIEDKESTTVEYLHLNMSKGTQESIQEIVLSQLQHYEVTLQLALKNINDYQTSVREYKGMHSLLEKKIQDMECQLKRSLEEHEAEIRMLKETHEKEKGNCEVLHKNTLNKVRNDLECKLETAERENKQQANINNTLTQERASLEEELRKVVNLKDNADKDVTILRFKVNKLKEAAGAWKVQAETSQFKLKDMYNSMVKYEKEVFQLKQDLGKALDRGKQCQLGRDQALQDLSLTKEQLFKCRDHVKCLLNNKQALKQQDKHNTDQLALYMNKSEEYETKYKNVIKDLRNKEKENRSLRIKVEVLEEQIKRWKEDFNTIQGKLSCPVKDQEDSNSIEKYLKKKFIE